MLRQRRRAKTRGRRSVRAAIRSDMEPNIAAVHARPDTRKHPWLHLKCDHSRREVREAHARDVGYYRAISHPFFLRDEDDFLTVEVKWEHTPDRKMALFTFQHVCEAFHDKEVFWEQVTRWVYAEPDPNIEDHLYSILTPLPVRWLAPLT